MGRYLPASMPLGTFCVAVSFWQLRKLNGNDDIYLDGSTHFIHNILSAHDMELQQQSAAVNNCISSETSYIEWLVVGYPYRLDRRNYRLAPVIENSPRHLTIEHINFIRSRYNKV